jgi:L-fuculose-phosphate aldolase
MHDTLADLYRTLGRDGLIVASAGNVSARTATGMLISPSGARADSIEPAHMVAMTLDGTAEGPLKPSSEWHMHAAIYLAFPHANAIVHTHADAATALACLNEPLPAFHYMLAEFGGDDIRCAPYVTFGTPALATLAVAALRDRTACLLANHGMICHGPTPEAALLTAQRLEALCRHYLLARAAGRPRILTPQEMADAHVRYRTYGQKHG